MNARRRIGGLEFQVRRDNSGFSFEVKGDPDYMAQRAEVFRRLDEVVSEARRAGVSVPEMMAYLARGRKTPPAAIE
jgi:hypothetical protein